MASTTSTAATGDNLHRGAGADQIRGGTGNDDFDDSDSASEPLDRTSVDNGANANL